MKKLLIALAFLLPLFLVLSCGSGKSSVEVKFEVTASVPSVWIVYLANHVVVDMENASVPWSYEFKGISGDLVGLSAGLLVDANDNETLTVTIYVDNSVLKTVTRYPGYQRWVDTQEIMLE